MSNWKVFVVLVLSIAVAGSRGLGAEQGAAALTAEDHAEIQQLYARYAHTIDSGDAAGWADTFTPDGVFANSRGRDGLMEFANNFHKSNGGYTRHWNTQILIMPTAEGATGSCYLLLYNTRTRPPTVIASAIYRDVLVKTSDGWRFTQRAAEVDRPAPSDR